MSDFYIRKADMAIKSYVLITCISDTAGDLRKPGETLTAEEVGDAKTIAYYLKAKAIEDAPAAKVEPKLTEAELKAKAEAEAKAKAEAEANAKK